MTDFLNQLNPQQRRAVESTEGPLLILAGAGSGKTRVITYRIAHLIENLRVPPETILAVTFTNKAAQQMKERVATLLGGSPGDGGPHISTFHSFCVRVLRRDIDRLGYNRDFSIYDEEDQQRLIRISTQELGLTEEVLSARAAQSRISHAKNRGISPADLYRQATDVQTEKLASLYDRYEKKLRESNALDFDDLLLKTVELFEKAPDICQLYNQFFRYLMVDEYQDTNRIQYRLIRQLTQGHQNICVVGDEDQSIYRWRGADIENILSFEKDYPDAKIIRLEQNYRSTQIILDAASAVVSHNRARIGKRLWSERAEGSRVGLYRAEDADAEAAFVADDLARALAEEPHGTVGVLYRTNAQSRLFEETLRRNNTQFQLVGGFRFYERAEIKDALAYARLAVNPKDNAAFLRIINVPPRGIGASTLSALQAAAQQLGLSLWETVEHELSRGASLPRLRKSLESFAAVVRPLMENHASVSLSEFFRNILDRAGYLAMLEAEGTLEAEGRIENLQELVNAAREAESRGETLSQFLDHAALVSDSDEYSERSRVTLMTLHTAKGLEFSTVYLVGMEEGLFPHKLSLMEDAALEEERRLCYVGMTRARQRLVLTWAARRRSYGEDYLRSTRPSRFLSEVPSSLLDRLDAEAPIFKTRTSWNNAFNSVESIEQFFDKHRPKYSEASQGSGTEVASTPRRWRLGSRVRHPKYGLGTVVDCEGEGQDAKVTVSFPGFGKKKLVERYASLTRA
ncbi:MAG TPA: UvrD-helicase domain-containing protein [Terriglobia bacterium]|nr:UvrD-helicase domain-containing protein [Terriglobia bacterium]